jgi:hypothetical protein
LERQAKVISHSCSEEFGFYCKFKKPLKALKRE